MANARDIRRRIKSIKNIQQITKAMKMVAAARLRRAQERALASQPYAQKLMEILHNVSAGLRDAKHPLLEVREVKTAGFLVIGADKGLAGAYTSNLVKAVIPQFGTNDNSALVTVGRKPRDYFQRRNYRVMDEYSGFSEKPDYDHATMLAGDIAERFINGELDAVYLVYTEFHSPLHQAPVTVKLLPLDKAGEKANGAEYIFEPSAEAVLNMLLPKYLETTIYTALMQAAASEQGARMTAMGAATDNAQELIAQLVLNYNKIRQATITREITEIVGGAEALK